MATEGPQQKKGVDPERGSAEPIIVAVGGSAGGLEAFRGFIAGLPPRSGIAYILVQHLDPDHPSMLADLLAKGTPFPVAEVTDGMALMPDRIHVIPSGALISVVGGVLRLSPSKENSEGPRLPIDYLLQSLALEAGLRVVAVILSGNGADGREGVRAVHDADGLVIVQDPAEATHDSMPKAAIATGMVDAVLPVAAMGAAIVDGRFAFQALAPTTEPKAWLATVLARLKAGGHDFSGYKVGTMQRRIERRAQMARLGKGHGTDIMPAYIKRLETDRDELQALANDLLINVTSFFRDEDVFATLAEKFLPQLVKDHDDEGPIRLWCAGCSTGEEAWSLAILLLEEIARTRPQLKLQIFATDLDPDAIATARRGFYANTVLESVSSERRQRFFVEQDSGWRVAPNLQSSVVFAVHDLLIDPPFSRIDMVSCRNLLIYLQNEAQARAISLFEFALRPGGLLLLGSAEAVSVKSVDKPEESPPVFTLISKQAHLYRRNVSHRVEAASGKSAVSFAARASAPPPLPVPALPSTRLQALESELSSLRAELTSANLHLEGAGVEQLAIHADTVSRNEEYQTTNEELLTSQEELQSLNEELVALNGQLQETIDQQRITSDDLQNILFSTDIATIFLDMDSHIRFYTPSTRAIFNMLPGDISRPLSDLVSAAPDPMLPKDIAAVLEGHKPIDNEIELPSGVCFSRCVTPYRTHNHRIEGVIITYTNVTERKKTLQAMREAQQSAEAANFAKSRFLAAASHDLRQPLQALVLLQGLMLRKSTDPEMRVMLARLDDTLGSMSSMLDGLLDINQIEAGAVKIEQHVFALDALIDETVQGMALQAGARKLKLRHVHTGFFVRSDRRLLAGMLQNLAANALKYTHKGGVLLGARRRGPEIVIEVWDTGIGIAANEIEAVFKPYYQLHSGQSAKGSRSEDAATPEGNLNDSGGLGLGLSIVRSLGDMLGHKISACSRVGTGSVFRISVPLAATPDDALVDAPANLTAEGADAAKALQAASPPLAPANILVIDDDGELRDLMGMMLREVGYKVKVVADEASAKQAFSAQTPDIIISDFRLPGPTDGLMLVQSMREALLETEGRVVPVIMVTGDISTEALARFASHDVQRLSKPVRPTLLLEAIYKALQKAPPAARSADGSKSLSASRLASNLVHVIDDDEALLRELSVLLSQACLPARLHGSAEAFRASWTPDEAGCLLIDAYLPGESGLSLMRSLKSAGTLPPTIMITGHGDIAMAVEAMHAGAVDFLEKPVSGAAIVESVGKALALSRDRSAQTHDRKARSARLATLTERQFEVMKMVLAGHPSKNIAADLGLSQRTVENHRAEIMRRTGCKSLPELARLVMTADPLASAVA